MGVCMYKYIRALDGQQQSGADTWWKNSVKFLDDDPLATGEGTAFLQLTKDTSEFNTLA